MLAWTRSLMKRASRSSSYSSAQMVISSDASAGLAAGIFDRRRPARAKTADTDLQALLADRLDELRLRQRDRRARSSGPTDPPRPSPPQAHSTISRDQRSCTSRSPCRRASRPSPPCALRLPACDAAADRALGDAVAVADLHLGRHLVERHLLGSARRCRTAATGALRAAACRGRRPASDTAALLMSPSRMPPTSRPSRMISFL